MKVATQNEVAANFAKYVQATKKGPVIVTNKGKPVAVLVVFLFCLGYLWASSPEDDLRLLIGKWSGDGEVGLTLEFKSGGKLDIIVLGLFQPWKYRIIEPGKLELMGADDKGVERKVRYSFKVTQRVLEIDFPEGLPNKFKRTR